VEFGKSEDEDVGRYRGVTKLVHYIDFGRTEEKAASGGGALVESEDELETFRTSSRRKKFVPAAFQSGSTVGGFVSLDGGSTSTKAVLLPKMVTSSARRISFRMVIPSRTPSTCSRSCVPKLSLRAQRWKYLG
jgi:activator of 2-hydroxyglutaryl-CoA dehydratase